MNNQEKPWVAVVFKIEDNHKELYGAFSSLAKAEAYLDDLANRGEVWGIEEFELDGP
jgi:hypothetical protein